MQKKIGQKPILENEEKMFYYTNLTNQELSKPLLKLFRREKSA